MILSDLAKFSKTWTIAWTLCVSWGSCWNVGYCRPTLQMS